MRKSARLGIVLSIWWLVISNAFYLFALATSDSNVPLATWTRYLTADGPLHWLFAWNLAPEDANGFQWSFPVFNAAGYVMFTLAPVATMWIMGVGLSYSWRFVAGAPR